MPKVFDKIIVAAATDPSAYTVLLTWANGAQTNHKFGNKMGRGVFAAFADPAFFAQARVGEHGRSLEWPNEIDLCADALWFEAHPEDAPRLKERVEP
ncbi:MAG TPA: DUF2442 domain-containing protein [Stellaceae bacterium]|nr:DUF2442 domain-containing protein [Stellaceae bacterium]